MLNAPLALFHTLAALAALIAGPAWAGTAEDTADVDHLIAAYHAAVVSHDAPRLSALFVPDGSAWFSVLTERGLARARGKRPDTPKVRRSSAEAFATMVATNKARLDPQHSNLKIRSDGTIATVTFDFSFLIDGKEQNSGTESWQLLKGEEGWRIVSILYSSTPPAS